MTVVEEGPLVRASQVLHAPLLDSRRERLGRVDDLIVRLGDGGYPPITGIAANIGGRRVFIPADRIAELEHGHVTITGETVHLRPFERRQGEVLLGEDVLDRRLIDVSAGRLVHANDIELSFVDGAWRVIGVDPRRRTRLARLLPGRPIEPQREHVVDWSDVEPFVGHVPTARLFLPLRRLKRMHPAQIADIVEGASRNEAKEILDAVEGDPELEADVIEELDTGHQIEYLESKSNEEIAEILAEVEPDDAADIIAELDQERRRPVLQLLPAEQHAKVMRLLAYNPETAGGMMSPDFVTAPAGASVAQALDAVRAAESDMQWQAASMVFLTDDERKLVGSVSVVDLLHADASAVITEVIDEPAAGRIDVDDDLESVALTMADYNLTAAPVVDRDGCIVGVITADDLIEALIPKDWRRRQIASSED